MHKHYSFEQFRNAEVQLSLALKSGSLNEEESKLFNSYVEQRLESFINRQGYYYRKLMLETGSASGCWTPRTLSQVKTVSRDTAAKLFKRTALPSFSSLAKMLAERNRELVIILEPFEGSTKRPISIRFSEKESAAYAVSSLLRTLLHRERKSLQTLIRLSGLSETTIRQAQKRQGNPLFDENISCPNVETVCRLAAACEYRMGILFCRPQADMDSMS